MLKSLLFRSAAAALRPSGVTLASRSLNRRHVGQVLMDCRSQNNAMAMVLSGRSFSNSATTSGSAQENKTALGHKILKLKKEKGLKWKDLAFKIGQSPVWTCALCLGQMSATPEQARKLGTYLGLNEAEIKFLSEIPYRGGTHPAPPTDPLVYRLQELIYVYGDTFKEVIQEEFGDGIMSAIDFDMSIERQPDPKGDRVLIKMSGKFLPYKRY